jgi:hypothetical protein
MSTIAYAYFCLVAVDSHMYQYTTDAYYASIRHSGNVGFVGAIVCLIGCVGLGITWSIPSLVQAGLGSIVGTVAVAFFGLFLFNLHGPTGALYFTVVGLVLGVGLLFFLIAGVRYIWQIVSHR